MKSESIFLFMAESEPESIFLIFGGVGAGVYLVIFGGVGARVYNFQTPGVETVAEVYFIPATPQPWYIGFWNGDGEEGYFYNSSL